MQNPFGMAPKPTLIPCFGHRCQRHPLPAPLQTRVEVKIGRHQARGN